MFRDEMFKELRDEIEVYERLKKIGKTPKEPILCRYIRERHEKDIRLVIRKYRFILQDAKRQQATLKYNKELAAYRENILDFLESFQKYGADTKEKFCNLLETPEAVSIKDAVQICRNDEICIGTLKEIDAVAQEILSVRNGVRKTDPYISLQEKYLDYKLGKVSQKELLGVMQKLLSANRKFRISKEYRKALKESKLSFGDTECIAEEVLSAILVAEAKDFLYDSGYGQDSAVKKSVSRRQDHILDLVELYLERNEDTGTISEDECLVTYEKMSEEKRENLFLPLQIDASSGAGLYILGKDYLEGKVLEQAEEEGYKTDLDCHFCYLYWQDIWEERGEVLVSMQAQVFGDDYAAAKKAFDKGRKVFDAFTDANGEHVSGVTGYVSKYFARPSRDYLVDREKAITARQKAEAQAQGKQEG